MGDRCVNQADQMAMISVRGFELVFPVYVTLVLVSV